MIAIGLLFVRMLCDYFKPRPQLEAEIVILRHQLNLLQRRAPRRRHLRWVDRDVCVPALFVANRRPHAERWGSGTDPRHSVPLGKTDMLNASSARSGASARTICWCSMPSTFGEFSRNTRPITMRFGPHVSLGKDAPCRRPVERFGHIVAYPVLGGLHHRYARI